MTELTGREVAPDAGENGTTYDLSKVVRISAHASLLSWLFALLGALGLPLAAYGLVNTIANWRPHDQVTDLAVFSLIVSFLLLVCFASSVTMRAVSEGILLLRDIEENARDKQ